MKKRYGRFVICAVFAVLLLNALIGKVRDIFETKAVFGNSNGIDISRDLTEGVPLFLQSDTRWGNKQYGTSDMAESGCGPTCLSMVWCGLTGGTKWDPYSVAQMAEEEGFYVKGVGSSWDLMTYGAAEMGMTGEVLTFDEFHIKNALENGNPIICAMGPGDFTTEGHFIVLTGLTEDGRIIVNDPNSKKRSMQSWDVENIMSQVRNLWVYSIK